MITVQECIVNEMKTNNVVKIPLPKLSLVELELLKFISQGLSNREIARLKNVKIKSCENAISRVAKKLNVRQSPTTNQRVLLANLFAKLEIETNSPR